MDNENPQLSKSLLYLMAFGAGLLVANNYYSQPLLHTIALDFNVSEATVSNIPLFTQIGYAVGLFFIIPLGDKVSRRKLILIDQILIIASLLLVGFAKNLNLVIIGSFFIGFSSVVPQLFVPMAAQLAKPNEKGKAIGVVMSGLLIGILGSRFISGVVGEYFGWRTMYFIASISIFLYGILLYYKLPDLKPTFHGAYKDLMKSLWSYLKNENDILLASIRGGLGFAGFSAFWTTLVFLLEDVFNYGSAAAGMFGVLGICGALAAGVMGKWSDKVNKNRLIVIATVIMIISWGIFEASTNSIIGLVIGVVLLDMGLQSLHITNQNIIFSKHPDAGNRVNTIYMVIYFIGGALGTITGAYAWQWFHWTGVATLGLCFTISILIVHFIGRRQRLKN